MERYKLSGYYCTCWYNLFPNCAMPNSNEEFIKAIVSSGNEVIGGYDEILNNPFKPILGPHEEIEMFYAEILSVYAMGQDFKISLYLLLSEMQATNAPVQHQIKIKKLYNLFESMEKSIDNILMLYEGEADHISQTKYYDHLPTRETLKSLKNARKFVKRMYLSEEEILYN